MADDRIVISSEPGHSPDEIARRSFPVVFRGYDQDEVRRFLKKVSDELVAARGREVELRHALDEARNQLAHPQIDEATLTAALGEETARILHSAREAANDMRTKAEDRVARMVQEADEHGARIREEAESVLARRVEEADEVAAKIRAAAEADAQAVHGRVEAELEAAKARGRDMIAEAHAVRERIIGDLARRRRAAQVQIEQLLAGRNRLLETYESVRGTFDEITAQLARAEDDARLAAEAAHHKAVATPPDDSDLVSYITPPPEVDSVPAEAAPPPEPVPAPAPEPAMAAEPPVEAGPAPAAHDDAWALPEPPEAPRPSLVRLEPFDEEEGVRIIGPVRPEAPSAEGEQAPPPPQVEPEPAPEPIPVAEAGPEPELDSEPEADPAPAPAPMAEEQHDESVDDLFARLRAERQVAVADAERVLATGGEPASRTRVVIAATPAAAAAEEVVEQADNDEEPAPDGDRPLLERREECLEPLASDLVRRLKRVLQDEQNEILDRLRQLRGRSRAEDALPSAHDQAARYADAAVGPLAEVVGAGATFAGATEAVDAPSQQWATALAEELVGGLRERVSRSLAATGVEGDDDSDAIDSLSAAYRQWKTERIDRIARHHVAMAFNAGILAAAPDGAALRWVSGDPSPCPDCDDNALAGPTAKGELYPTGQAHPPAHAGCGCLLVLVG